MNRDTDTSDIKQSGIATSKKLKSGAETSNFSSISIIGHRGAGARSINKHAKGREIYPENSLISFREIMKSGAQGIEFDLHVSLDGMLMVVHDDDLIINCYGVVIQKNSKNIGGSDIGSKYKLETLADLNQRKPGEEYKLYVSKYPCHQLQTEFDISMGFDLSKVSPVDLPLYTKMPEFTEVLDLVRNENISRQSRGIPGVKLNIELKGPKTGELVESAIKYFNDKHKENKILSSDVYYISFSMQELLNVLKHAPKANVVFGVPTKMQYSMVDEEYNILDDSSNQKGLEEIERFNRQIKSTGGRENRGLDGVDMSIWDVSDKSIELFCKNLKLPIHLAIVPFSIETLKSIHITPVLSNFWKIIKAQSSSIGGDLDFCIFVKTDEPLRLKDVLLDDQYAPDNDRNIISVEKFQPTSELADKPALNLYEMHKKHNSEHNISLFPKAGAATKILALRQ